MRELNPVREGGTEKKRGLKKKHAVGHLQQDWRKHSRTGPKKKSKFGLPGKTKRNKQGETKTDVGDGAGSGAWGIRGVRRKCRPARERKVGYEMVGVENAGTASGP